MQISSIKKKGECKYKYILVDKKGHIQIQIFRLVLQIHTGYLEMFFSSSLCLVFVYEMAKGQKVDAEDMKGGDRDVDGNTKTLKVLRKFCQILWLQQEVVWMKNVATIFPTFKVDS